MIIVWLLYNINTAAIHKWHTVNSEQNLIFLSSCRTTRIWSESSEISLQITIKAEENYCRRNASFNTKDVVCILTKAAVITLNYIKQLCSKITFGRSAKKACMIYKSDRLGDCMKSVNCNGVVSNDVTSLSYRPPDRNRRSGIGGISRIGLQSINDTRLCLGNEVWQRDGFGTAVEKVRTK